MAEEELNPVKEGRRIVQEYLSKRGWALEWRRSLSRQLYPAVNREEFEDKQRQCDRLEEDAEEIFSREVERWRKDTSPEAKEVLHAIVDALGKRLDLGFYAKRIVERLKRDLEPF